MSRLQSKVSTRTEMDLQIPKDRILSSQQLKNLKEHKYSCLSNSFLDPFMQKWWCWLVEQCPLWVAPNLITIVGLVINIVTTLILVAYSPDGKQEPPRWACFLCALGLFIYQSLDAIDGKQARRTGSSSPLGELFDHGCDSVSAICVALSACLAVQLGFHPQWMFLQCFCALTLFYCAHWQAYVSGTLQFGKFDVTEAQFGIIAIHLISTFFGPGIWSLTVPYLGINWKVAAEIAVMGLSLNSFFGYLPCILGGGIGKNGSTIAGTSVLSPAIPISLVLVPAYVIAGKSPELYENHPALYIIAFGIVAAKVTNRLVIAHMTKSELNYFDSSMFGPALVFLNQYFDKYFSEYYVLWLCLIWVTVDFLRYCKTVCYEICDHLNIELFRITPTQPSKNGNLKKNGHAH